MIPALGLIGALWACGGPCFAQDAKMVETRFHRVHLKNGNFVDGALLRESDQEVILKLRDGEFTIRRHLVDRVEFVKMRSVEYVRRPEPPKEAAPGKKGIALMKEEPLPDPQASRAALPAGVAEALGAKVTAILSRLAKAEAVHKHDVARELLSAGDGAGACVSALLDTCDEEDLPYVELVLKKMKDRACVEPLSKQLESKRAEVRKVGVSVLGVLGRKGALNQVRGRLEDEDARVREAAVGALEASDDWTVLKPMARRVADLDENVRKRASAAAHALAKKFGLLGDLKDELLSHLDNTRGDPKAEVASALLKLADTGLTDTFLKLLEDDTPSVRAVAAKALALPEAEEALLRLLSVERDGRVKVELAGSLGRLKSGKGEATLLLWLEDREREVRVAAAGALRRITGRVHDVDHEGCSECHKGGAPKRP